MAKTVGRYRDDASASSPTSPSSSFCSMQLLNLLHEYIVVLMSPEGRKQPHKRIMPRST
jgi:hypothetical protein